MNLFKQRKTKLFNGKEVKEGDTVYFIDSDKNKREYKIKRRMYNYKHSEREEILKKGTLFFCNATFQPSDYRNADVS
jgi:signal peptidase I